MRFSSTWILAAALIGASTSAGAQGVYDVTDFQVGGGYYLTGTIDVTNAAVAAGGNLTSASDFTAARIGLYNSANTLVSTLAIDACEIGCGLAVTGRNLTISSGANGNLEINNGSTICEIGTSAVCAIGSAIVDPSIAPGENFAAAAAPEIDSRTAAGGLALLVCALAVLLGRRQRGFAA